eukprot:PhM_4_TR14134/c1_g1_i3/m.39323
MNNSHHSNSGTSTTLSTPKHKEEDDEDVTCDDNNNNDIYNSNTSTSRIKRGSSNNNNNCVEDDNNNNNNNNNNNDINTNGTVAPQLITPAISGRSINNNNDNNNDNKDDDDAALVSHLVGHSKNYNNRIRNNGGRVGVDTMAATITTVSRQNEVRSRAHHIFGHNETIESSVRMDASCFEVSWNALEAASLRSQKQQQQQQKNNKNNKNNKSSGSCPSSQNRYQRHCFTQCYYNEKNETKFLAFADRYALRSSRLWAWAALYTTLYFLLFYRPDPLKIDISFVIGVFHVSLFVFLHLYLSFMKETLEKRFGLCRDDVSAIIIVVDAMCNSYSVVLLDPPRHTIAAMFGATLVALHTSSVRASRSMCQPFLLIGSHVLYATFLDGGSYWQERGYGEIAYYPFFLIPIGFQFCFESLVRDAFEVSDAVELTAQAIEAQCSFLREVLVSFFSPTATIQLKQLADTMLDQSSMVMAQHRNETSARKMSTVPLSISRPRHTYPSTVIVAAQTSIADGEFAMARVDPEDLV